MSSDFERNLEKYAEVILRMGLNLQPGQRLLVGWPAVGLYGTPIELAPLVRPIVRQAYQMGARLVDVLWNDDQVRLLRYQHAPRDSFAEFPQWRAQAAIDAAKSGDATLRINAQDPDLLAGQDSELVSLVNATNTRELAPFSQIQSRNGTNWCVVTAPVEGWGEKIFPDMQPVRAKERFWEVLFSICRVDRPDPVAAWRDHIASQVARKEYLNGKRYDTLHFRGGGTDLLVGLAQGHLWSGATSVSQTGIEFTANVPTEEIFTTPHRERTEGVAVLSKPICYGGTVVEGARFGFQDGQLVSVEAEKNETFLRRLLSIDDGAHRLGEVALVPHSSPIAQSGLLFYSTLIDENAASHIALGRAYPSAVEGGATMTADEFAAIGGNQSLLHLDCMIGSGEIDVDGVDAEGNAEPVMRRGEWAFDI